MGEAFALANQNQTATAATEGSKRRGQRWEIIAGVLPFLTFTLAMAAYEMAPRAWVAGPIGLWCYVTLYAAGILGLGIGWVRGFPRWSYAYAGLVLMIAGWWSDSDNVYGWGLIKPASRILFWAMVLVALGLTRSLRPVGRFFQGMWRDWTRLSFLSYTFTPVILLNMAFDFVSGNYPLPYPIFASLVLAGGALAYLCSRSTAQRAVALMAGMTLTWLVAAVELALYLERTPRAPGLWAGQLEELLPYWGWLMVLLLAPALLGLLRRLLVAILLLLVVLMTPALSLDVLSLVPASSAADTVILADPEDAYYPLAEEMAFGERLPLVHTLDEAMERDPAYLLWVVSPGGLSDRAMVDLGLAMRDWSSAVSVGIFSGASLQEARALWLRAGQARGSRVVVANAANPSGHIEATIYTYADGSVSSQPLTRTNLLGQLQQADYLTFTGHGSKSYLRLDEETVLRPADLPTLPPIVVATGSCNTFRPWEENSIALAFTGQGAAAYTGFAYSPNEGYLIGEFDGLPFRYTWPDYPIGHVVQVQNRGTLQGFAQFPYYHLLGDPRIALQAEAPYQVVEDRESASSRTLAFAPTAAGMIPVRIPDGARYSFVEIPGVSAAWEGDPFYNARLQMVDIQEDKYLLFAHPGGSFTLHLRTSPPWLWVAGDIVSDALDNTLLYVPQTGGAIVSLGVAVVALGAVAWLLLRKKATTRALVPAILVGLGFAALHGLYALVHLESLTITSKFVAFSPLALISTFLLVGCGAFLYFNARSWRGKGVALVVASVGALAPAVFTLGLLGVMNNILLRPRLGTGLWNYTLGLQSLVALVLEVILFAVVFFALNRTIKSDEKEQVRT